MSPFRRTALALGMAVVIVVSAMLTAGCFSAGPAPWDLILRGGTVVDGTGGPPFRADVAVKGDRIGVISSPVEGRARRTIDVTGLVVAPGFIDIHVHARAGIFRSPAAESQLRQGVTTVIDGPDGSSALPLAPFLARADAAGLALNVGSFIGQGSVREAVVPSEDRPATDDEIGRMKDLVREAMGDGAFGLSSGLFYVPGAFTPAAEVAALARVAGWQGGVYETHVRSEAAGLVASVEEALEIGERAGIPVHVSHHKAIGRTSWGKTKDTLGLIAAARARGRDVTLDVYPYTASKTGLAALLPPSALAGGRPALLSRLGDPSERIRLRAAAAVSLRDERGAGDPKNVVISTSTGEPSAAGRNLAELTRARGAEPTFEEAAETALQLMEKGDCTAIYHALSEEDVERVLRDPGTMVASDGEIVVYGEAFPHPRSYGTFARVLAVYVREKKVLGLEEAVHKMSGLPAWRLHLSDRGLLRGGRYADLVVFDPAAVRDRATFESPHQYAEGVSYVMVNGELVIDAGRLTSSRPGRALRHR